ncbi:MAG: copper-binding protein [Spirochaetes bacterium]|nr:copper-binding protein [Spirochaetota bacterium]
MPPQKILRTAVLALSALTVFSCNRPTHADKAPKVPARSYEMRGIVSALPERSGQPVMIRHEAIHDFVDSFGERVGMNAMTMPFDLARGVSLSNIAPGDKVSFTWAVDWGKNDARIQRIQKLPGETVLVFGKAKPEAVAPASR